MQHCIENLMQFTISQTVKEICNIIQKSVSCVHKPGFLMPGHIYS